jgi:lysophospholipase
MNISGFDAGSFMDRVSQNVSELPNVGIAFSGGGWRALLNGAGALAAFDSRTSNSMNTGQIGGLLQASTYVAGLSGGSWLLGSIYVNNFTTVEALRDDDTSTVWEFSNAIIEGPPSNGIQMLSTAEYYTNIANTVNAKRDAGFNASITDIWARGLSFQLINATDGGPKYTWSSIALTQGFQNADQPFPIVVANARAPGEVIISLNATVFEFTPYEMGTHDPRAFGFVPTQYLGTEFRNGSVVDDDQCVVGFDNAGFVMGTSSSLFNQIILTVNLSNSEIPSFVANELQDFLTNLGKADNDIADYSPNPFYGYNPDTNPSAAVKRLTLVDGGEDLQNIPLHPLIQPERHVDVIFAVDSSGDVNPGTVNYPNGTALVATYERQFGAISNGTAFPSIPDQNTFVNLGLNSRPTFFGCNASNITVADNNKGYAGLDVPLIVYIPNAPYIIQSDPATFTLTYNDTFRNKLIENGYDVATMGNGTVEETWPMCVGCAVIARSLQRTGTEMPRACTNCFDRFCWNGTLASDAPAQEYKPSPKLGAADITSAAESVKVRSWSALAAAVAVWAITSM